MDKLSIVFFLRGEVMQLQKIMEFKTAYRVVLLLLCAAGLGVGIWYPGGLRVQLCYFTTLSNLLVLFYYLAVLCLKRGERPLFKGAVTVCIILTMCMYHASLIYEGRHSVGARDLVLHYLLPLSVLFDYLLFGAKGAFKPYYPLLWVVLPALYFCAITVRAEVGCPLEFIGGLSRYPYFVIDADIIGIGGYVAAAFAIVALILVIGYALFALDRAAVRLVARDARRELPARSPLFPVLEPPESDEAVRQKCAVKPARQLPTEPQAH